MKWGGAVVTVLLFAAWLWSGRWSASGVVQSGDSWQFAGGTLFLMCPHDHDPLRPRGFRGIFHNAGGHVWNLEWGSYRVPGSWWVQFPIWILLVLSAPVTAIAWRLDTLALRRSGLNLCRNCGYERAGLAAGAVCPECGAGAGTCSI